MNLWSTLRYEALATHPTVQNPQTDSSVHTDPLVPDIDGKQRAIMVEWVDSVFLELITAYVSSLQLWDLTSTRMQSIYYFYALKCFSSIVCQTCSAEYEDRMTWNCRIKTQQRDLVQLLFDK